MGRIKGIVRVLGPAAVLLSAFWLISFWIGAVHWTFEQASYWLPFHCFLALTGAGVCAFFKRWRFLFLGLGVAAAFLVPLAKSCLPPSNEANKKAAIPVRVMQANLFARNRNPSRFLELVRETRPDILVFQEAEGPWGNALGPVLEGYPYGHVGPEEQGVRKDLKQCCRIPSEKPRSLADEGVPGFETIVRAQEMTFHLISVHTRAPFSPYRAKRHREQMTALANACQKAAHPLVVVGDLNSSTWSHLFIDLRRKTGLCPARSGFGILGTWPSFMGPFRTPIDHILVSPDIRVLRCWVGPDIGSDHRPLLADLLVPGVQGDEKRKSPRARVGFSFSRGRRDLNPRGEGDEEVTNQDTECTDRPQIGSGSPNSQGRKGRERNAPGQSRPIPRQKKCDLCVTCEKLPEDLRRVMMAWGKLSEEERLTILNLANSSAGGKR